MSIYVWRGSFGFDSYVDSCIVVLAHTLDEARKIANDELLGYTPGEISEEPVVIPLDSPRFVVASNIN